MIYIVGYFIVFAILWGFWYTKWTHDRIKDPASSAFAAAILWPFSILFNIGCTLADMVKVDD